MSDNLDIDKTYLEFRYLFTCVLMGQHCFNTFGATGNILLPVAANVFKLFWTNSIQQRNNAVSTSPSRHDAATALKLNELFSFITDMQELN